ncbi:hypothetical protein Tco_0817627 [Tanacetum coccineum]
MVDSQLEGEGAQRVEAEGTGMSSREGPFEPAQLAQTTPSPAFIKENIDTLKTMIREHNQHAKVWNARHGSFLWEESKEFVPLQDIIPSKEPEPRSGTRGTFILDGLEVKIKSKEGAVQENLEGAWGHALPTQEEKRSHPSPKHQRRSWKWKV